MKRILFALLFLCSFVSSAYILHLEYDGQNVVQKGVYYSELAQVPQENEGIYSLNLGVHEANFSFPVLMAYDDEEFSNGRIEKIQKTEQFVVVPEVPDFTMLRVEKEGKVLLDEEIKEPQDTNVIWKPLNRCETDWDCTGGLVCDQRVCVGDYVGMQCNGDEDCPAEQYCIDGTCAGENPICLPFAGFFVGLAVYVRWRN